MTYEETCLVTTEADDNHIEIIMTELDATYCHPPSRDVKRSGGETLGKRTLSIGGVYYFVTL